MERFVAFPAQTLRSKSQDSTRPNQIAPLILWGCGRITACSCVTDNAAALISTVVNDRSEVGRPGTGRIHYSGQK